jgi:hypothetical protein
MRFKYFVLAVIRFTQYAGNSLLSGVLAIIDELAPALDDGEVPDTEGDETEFSDLRELERIG